MEFSLNILLEFFVLLCLFELKHFLADFPFQTSYMLQKFRKDWGFVRPLALHCSVHAMATALLVGGYVLWKGSGAYNLVLVAFVFDFVTHFIMDRIKSAPHYWGKYQVASPREISNLRHTKLLNRKERRHAGAKIKMPGYKTKVSERAALLEAEKMLKDNKIFWISLGIDQMVHHLVQFIIVFVLLFNVL